MMREVEKMEESVVRLRREKDAEATVATWLFDRLMALLALLLCWGINFLLAVCLYHIDGMPLSPLKTLQPHVPPPSSCYEIWCVRREEMKPFCGCRRVGPRPGQEKHVSAPILQRSGCSLQLHRFHPEPVFSLSSYVRKEAGKSCC